MTDVPLYAHTDVLGVDIGDHQQTPKYGTDINVYPHYPHWGPNVYEELCDWIRRNGVHK